VNPPDLPRSAVRGRRLVVALLAVSAAVGAGSVVAIIVLLVPLILELRP